MAVCAAFPDLIYAFISLFLVFGKTEAEFSTFTRQVDSSVTLEKSIKVVQAASELDCALFCNVELSCKLALYALKTRSCELGSGGGGTTINRQGTVIVTKVDFENNPPSSKDEEDKPSSCREVVEKGKSTGSGVYNITTKHAGLVPVFCQMDDSSACGNGGWTLVMKINGDLPTFAYNSPYWTDSAPYYAERGLDLGITETKLPTYWSTPFTRICLGVKSMRSGGTVLWSHIAFNKPLPSLLSLIQSAEPFVPKGLAGWKSSVDPSAQMLTGVTKEGTSLFLYNTGVRLGFMGTVSSWSSPKYRPASYLGVGTWGWWHTSKGGVSCGNGEANYDPMTNQVVASKTPAFCYIFVK